MKNIITFIACTLGVLLIGSISGLANAGNITGWYSTLQKPSFNPPNYLFGPVWTVLYILMGVSLFLIIKTPNTEQRTTALIIFAAQLFLNFMWSFIFFYFKLTGVAAIEIVLIWISIVFMIFLFYKLSPGAAYLQIPYLLWVSFASVLNISIWYLNKH
jgi:tryptophan-rich sensory protein